MDQILTLGPGDDIYHLRSLIQWDQTRRVIIQVPRSCEAIKTRFAFQLLRRWADDARIQIAIAPDEREYRGLDPELVELAGEAEIPVFGSLERAQKSSWPWAGPEHDLVDQELHSLSDDAPAWTVRRALGLSWGQLAVTFSLSLASLFVLGAAAFWLVPSATVHVTPTAQPIYNTSNITLDPTATGTDVENATIIARVITTDISGTATIATSRTQDAPATRSVGQAVFTNLAGVETLIPRGTIVETSAGVTVRFSTTSTSTLPSGYGSRVTVPIQAIDLGPIGNVRALQINLIEGPVAGAARVINPSPTGGGLVKPVRVVTRDDKSRLSTQLEAQMQGLGLSRLSSEAQRAGDEAGVDFYLVPDSVKVQITDQTFDHLVDDPADVLALKMEAQARGVVVSRKRLSDFAASVLKSEVTLGYTMLPASVQYDIDPTSKIEKGFYLLKLKSVAFQVPKLDSHNIVKGISGLSLDEAKDFIKKEANLAKPPDIQIYPFGWRKMPLLTFRIAVFVDSPTSGNSPANQ